MTLLTIAITVLALSAFVFLFPVLRPLWASDHRRLYTLGERVRIVVTDLKFVLSLKDSAGSRLRRLLWPVFVGLPVSVVLLIPALVGGLLGFLAGPLWLGFSIAKDFFFGTLDMSANFLDRKGQAVVARVADAARGQ